MIKNPRAIQIGCFLFVLIFMDILIGVIVHGLGLHGIPGMIVSDMIGLSVDAVAMIYVFGWKAVLPK